MPTYPINKTYKGGFYNNKIDASGNDDRTYSAEDIRKPYDVIYSDGIKPDADGTSGDNLKVTTNNDMSITVRPGFAKLGGAWFENSANYIIGLDNAIATTRYDCVILRNDDSDDVRSPSIYIKSLTAIPTINNLERSDKVYEVCLAYVTITSTTTSISSSMITDTRDDGELCNVMSGVGATVVRTFNNTVYSERAGQTGITIGIPQYDRNKDTLIVIVEGRTFTQGVNYTIPSNTYIELTIGLPVIGTRIDFQVLKNVNAAGAYTVVQEVAQLNNDVANINHKLENHYYCNGATDNYNISKLIENFLSAGTNYDSMNLVIHGHFGVTNPYSGVGTSASPYVWIRAGHGSETNRRVYLDFKDCSQININCADNTYNIILFGLQVNVSGINIIATGNANILMFSSAALTFVNADHCRFWITANAGYIARGGDFKNCRASITTNTDNAYCFNTLKGGLLRVYGGEYYAYAPSTYFSTVVYVNSGQAGAIVNTYSMNCPTVARSGYVQTYAINCLTADACCSFTDTITTLDIVSTDQNNRGHIEQNRPGLI